MHLLKYSKKTKRYKEARNMMTLLNILKEYNNAFVSGTLQMEMISMQVDFLVPLKKIKQAPVLNWQHQ